MNRIQRRSRSLQAILGLRKLSEDCAESEVRMAELRVMASRNQEQKEREDLEQTVQGWIAIHESGSFSPELTVSWSGAVDFQVERVKAATNALSGEQKKLDSAREVHLRAMAERDCAEVLLTRSRKRYAIWREEKNMAEIGDDILRRHAMNIR